MAIPGFQELTKPVLEFATNGEFHKNDAVAYLAEKFSLTHEERTELLPSGAEPTFNNRVGWAIAYLKKASLLGRPKRAIYMITAEGLRILKENPAKIDLKYLLQFEGVRDFTKTSKTDNSTGAPLDSFNETPDEAISKAFEVLQKQLAADLLERIKAMPPRGFELLILDLMEAMGYGARGSKHHSGRTGDGGIDGIIYEDALGLDAVYLQAKRYNNTTVGTAEMNSFIGALVTNKAVKGVFVTSSTFSDAAKKQVEMANTYRIMLIDGEELTRLMIKYGLGVRTTQKYEIRRVDTDLFEEYDETA